ncbi:MAG: NAD(P)-dependent oxidoreductase [PVC group bacterium]|nr:NAD(P)-dependent oxidoreductase [PVC group bacterium]
MSRKSKILLTGATGFLGSHLLSGLIDNDYEVIILKRSFDPVWKIKDLQTRIKSYDLDKSDLEDVFKENKIDIIIHLATDYGKDSKSKVNRVISTNIEFPARLMELAVNYEIKFFVNTHTASPSTYLFYSATKNAFLEIAGFYAANHNLSFVNMVIEYMYGERDDDIKFIPAIINKIFKGEEIKASGGEQERDFIYVGDVVNAYLLLLKKTDNIKDDFTEFNIGTGDVMSFRTFIEKIEKSIEKKAIVSWGAVPYRKNELFYSKADISHINQVLGWSPEVSLEQGLLNTVGWYRNQQEDNSQ